MLDTKEKENNLCDNKTIKPCNGLCREILESPALNAFKSRKRAARKGKDIADDTMDNLPSSFQVVRKFYNEEEKSVFQVVARSFPFPHVSLFLSATLKCS